MTMEEDFVNLLDFDSISCRITVSADTSSGSHYSPNSSTTGSTGCEDTLQASAPYRMSNPTVPDLQDVSVLHHGCTGEPKHHCTHDKHPEGERPTFTTKKELNRHMKEHDPNAPRWHCGCCQNLGDNFEGKTRKDKVQIHLRTIHEKPKSKDNLGILCPEDSCPMLLFTVASCLDEHMRQVHPNHPRDMPSQITNGSTCDCKQRAETKRLQESLQSSGMNKHRAGSPLESTAKRGRHDPVGYHSSELVPYSARLHASRIDPLAGMTSTEFPFPPVIDAFLHPANFAEWGVATTSRDPYYNELASMNPGIDTFQTCAPVDDYCHWAPRPLHKRFLEDSKPADFLAIRKTQDFKNLTDILRVTYDEYRFDASPITYNPEKETITLTGCSESKVNNAMHHLLLLVENFSQRWGGKYLAKSQPSTSRALMLDSSRARSSTNSRTWKVFPIKPKEHRRLVQIWYKSILPALPRILKPRLGGNYAASLVRRGEIDLGATPCIQIESPCLPGSTAQRIIKDSVDEICKKDDHEPISVHFTKGSVKKLNGGGGENDDDGGESEDLQRLELSYNRPYSKPGMGASIGLLCSKNVSATLGGYVLIGGEKYLLTSEHFVSESREPENRDDNDPDCVTLISPSRWDLNKIENNLKQTRRDIDGEINSLMRRTYGDKDIPEDAFSDPKNLTRELCEALRRNDDVKSLLEQVTKPPIEYAVGTVEKFSLEPRTGTISRSLANDVGLRNDQLMVKHQMDWALFKTNSQTAQAGENRHKYRSNEDAMDDHYIDERNRASPAGDICHETCGAEAGYTVYYVGQESKHRVGKVHMPTLQCIDSTETLAWGISDLHGHGIPYSDVAGDSGAWVIRELGNKLMGQVHSHSQGRVLFTPIDVIFDDLEEACGTDVSLPPRAPDPGEISRPIHAKPLCSAPRKPPPVRSYPYLKPHPVASTSPQEVSPVGTPLSETRPLESSCETSTLSDTETAHGQRSSNLFCDSPSSLPSLSNSPQSPFTMPDSPKSPRSSGDADIGNGQVDIKTLPSSSFLTTVGEPAMSEISDLLPEWQRGDQPTELESCAFQFKDHSLFRLTSSTRTPTWPLHLGSRVTKARRGPGFPLLQTSRDHAVLYVACSLLDKFARLHRRIEDVTDIETISSPSEHKASTLSMLQDVSKKGYSKSCSVAA